MANRHKTVPLYTGTPITSQQYEDWHEDALTSLLNLFKRPHSPLLDNHILSKLRHRIWLNLSSPRSYYIPSDVLHLVDRFKAEQIPYGVVANSGPDFTALLRGVDSRIKHSSYVTVSPTTGLPTRGPLSFGKRVKMPLIPNISAGTLGIPKPRPEIFLSLLKNIRPPVKDVSNVYYVGTDPLVDYAPSTRLGLKSVLVTRNLEKRVSDLTYLSARKARQLSGFRIKGVRELERVFFGQRGTGQVEPTESAH